jgi:hypothetical protein
MSNLTEWSYEYDGDAVERLERDERLHSLEAFEKQLARRRVVPDASKLFVRRFGFLLHLVGAAAIGLFVAMMAVLINFIVFTKILHL